MNLFNFWKNWSLIVCIVVAITFVACDSENGSDCLKKEGTIVQRDIELTSFTEIVVFEGVQLFIEEGPSHKVILESGENLINDVEVKVEGALLTVINNNTCNFIRDYNITKVYITSPNITKIRNSSSLEIISIGVLNYPELTLYSENHENEDYYHNNGNFNLNLNVQKLTIISNGFSTFRLNGNADKANFGLYSGNTRILAENLMVKKLNLYHRSTNKMVVNPTESIQGEICSVGDVIAKNRPPMVEVEELFIGKLIFED